ncbi:hypothetical protein OIO90_006048 [Microbotryomycetes sp. JL221]|nr:hypothetical protein OIO90_006048 [Microbotryomycetes sp. JL221]
MALDVAQRLKLLESIPPLFEPSLPSPPPSPNAGSNSRKRTLSDATTTATTQTTKQQPQHQGRHKSSSTSTTAVHGLGLIHDEPANNHGHKHDGQSRSRSISAATRRTSSSDQDTLVAPTPKHKQLSFETSPWLGSGSFHGASAPTMPPSPWLDKPGQDWRVAYPKERLRKLAAKYRDKGRTLKHSGDAIARQAHSSTGPRAKLALANQTEAILMYMFAFWCDDMAAKACIPSNWKTIFPLLAFVKQRADKDKQTIITGLCLRMEALAVHALAMHDQKMLHHQATKLLGSSSSSSSLHPPPPPPPPRLPPPPPPPPPASLDNAKTSVTSPASTDGSVNTPKANDEAGTKLSPIVSPSVPNLTHALPPKPQTRPAPPPPPPPSSTGSSTNMMKPSTSTSGTGLTTELNTLDLLKQFTKSGTELFKSQKLWEQSCNLLNSIELIKFCPQVWLFCLNFGSKVDAKEFCLPVKVSSQHFGLNPDVVDDDDKDDDEQRQQRDNKDKDDGLFKFWRFAWPVDCYRTMSVPHSVAFARAVLEEWCETERVEGFEPAVITED